MTIKRHQKVQACHGVAQQRGRAIRGAVHRRHINVVGARGAVNAHSPTLIKKQRVAQPVCSIQSKNPATFARVKWPVNVVLGKTIETNRDALCRAISKAPPPSRRLLDFLAIDHRSKMVTIEPVMAFDMDVMVDWMGKLNPCLIWLGFDTKGCGLPEPTMEQVRELHWRLSLLGIPVRLKDVRTAAA